MTIRSLIIDDDPFILDLLRDKLQQYCPEVKVLASADSGEKGLALIQRYHPDLIFLDVEMKDMTGFELLARIDHITFQTIFITSYSHYAIKAIRFNALDYLVKPIDLGELKQAIKRYETRLRTGGKMPSISHALNNLHTPDPSDQVLRLYLQDGELSLILKDIIRIEGERNYSNVFLVGDRKKLISKALGGFEELLNDKGFFRCHKSHLVNTHHIKAYPNSATLILSDGTRIPIARRKKEEFRVRYGSLTF